MRKQLDEFAEQLTVDESLTPVSIMHVVKKVGRVLNLVFYLQEQQATKLKNEKLKIAMLKLKEASVQKVGYIADFRCINCMYFILYGSILQLLLWLHLSNACM